MSWWCHLFFLAAFVRAHLTSRPSSFPFPFALTLTLAYAVKQAQPTASMPFEQHRLGTLLAYRSPATAIDPSASDRLYLRTASALRQCRRAANM